MKTSVMKMADRKQVYKIRLISCMNIYGLHYSCIHKKKNQPTCPSPSSIKKSWLWNNRSTSFIYLCVCLNYEVHKCSYMMLIYCIDFFYYFLSHTNRLSLTYTREVAIINNSLISHVFYLYFRSLFYTYPHIVSVSERCVLKSTPKYFTHPGDFLRNTV